MSVWLFGRKVAELRLRGEGLRLVGQCLETGREGKGRETPQAVLWLEGGRGLRTRSAKFDCLVFYIFGWFEYMGSSFKTQI